MASARDRLAEAELEHIYTRRIRPDAFAGVAPAARPTAVLVGGQPGAGKSYAIARLRAQLAASAGSAAVVSGDELREYHPYWRANALSDPQSAAKTQADAGAWYTRLLDEALQRRVNVVLETTMRQPDAVIALTSRLRREGYTTTATVIAVDKERSRLAVMARYDIARTEGDVPRFVPARYHEGAYDQLRDTIGRIEATRAVDSLRIADRDGRAVYTNELQGEQWRRTPQGVALLDSVRERPLTARELADNALRWETLAQRLALDPFVRRDVASQTLAWRAEAAARAERDPQARQLLTWAREAEAFRTLNRHQFAREFPHHAQAIERLDKAVSEAEKYDEREGARFIELARQRISERIERGDFAPPKGKVQQQHKDRGDKTR